jgi:hypothetical protein
LGQGERSFQGVSNDGGGIAVLISVKTSRFTVHGVSARPPALAAQALLCSNGKSPAFFHKISASFKNRKTFLISAQLRASFAIFSTKKLKI